MKPEPKRSRARVPWVPLILLVLSVIIFWILPLQMGKPSVRVESGTPPNAQTATPEAQPKLAEPSATKDAQ